MKFSLFAVGAFALLASLFNVVVGSDLVSFHRDQPSMVDVRSFAATLQGDGRNLEIDEFITFWLVNAISDKEAWCMTAAEGTKEFGNMKLQPCDFTGTDKRQLFYLPIDSEDEKIRSALDDSLCITMNHGENLFDGVRARLADCENGLNTFYYEGLIHVAEDDSYCLTNRGPKPHDTDWIHAKPCMERADFFWIPIPNLPYHVQLTAGGGCAQPREGSRRVFLDECDEEKAWRISPIDFLGESALVRSGLDDDKCLRAGTGSTMEDGTRMALVDCDPEDELQHFIYTGTTVHANYNFDLCMVYRGVKPHVGVDPVIMKECNDRQEMWDLIEFSYY